MLSAGRCRMPPKKDPDTLAFSIKMCNFATKVAYKMCDISQKVAYKMCDISQKVAYKMCDFL